MTSLLTSYRIAPTRAMRRSHQIKGLVLRSVWLTLLQIEVSRADEQLMS